MRYIFLVLLVLNILMFGYYRFVHQPSESQSLIAAKSSLINPVTVTNVSSELPPMTGTKK